MREHSIRTAQAQGEGVGGKGVGGDVGWQSRLREIEKEKEKKREKKRKKSADIIALHPPSGQEKLYL